MMMGTLAFCQSGYPKKVIYNDDTVVLITISQIKIVNNTKIERDKLKKDNHTLRTKCDSLIENCDNLTSIYKENYELEQKINIKNKKAISSYKDNEKDWKQMVKNEKRKGNKKALGGVLIGFLLGVLTVLI